MKTSPLKYHHVIGIMSGTSLDGLDLAYCIYREKEECKDFKVFKGL